MSEHYSQARAEKPTYDQAFFLDLAMKGKNVWNAWRRDPANKETYVTFADMDFSEAPKDTIDFTDFEFGDCANFSKCKWPGADLFHAGDDFAPGRACFTGASFGVRANFEGAIFGNFAKFAGVSFGWKTSFVGATFGQYANFTGAIFDDQANFEFAVFDGVAGFDGTHFEGVNFRGATFGVMSSFRGADILFSNFDGAAFGDHIDFSDTSFKGDTTFSGRSITHWTGVLQLITQNLGPEAQKALEKRHKDSWKIYDSAPDRFLRISFQNAHFEDNANFSGRDFQHLVNFNDVQFCHAPDFDAVTNASRIDFAGARITPSESEDIIRLRAFRKLAEETRNHDLERDLYIEERKAEQSVSLRRRWGELRDAPIRTKLFVLWRLLVRCLWIAIMFGYLVLADYGRSVERPLAWFIFSVFIFHCGYAAILSPDRQRENSPTKTYHDRAVWMLALGNALPFVGHLSLDSEIKKTLYCPNCASTEPAAIPPLGIQVLVIMQNVVSLALIFFFGLAMRNYFKIR